MYLDSALSLAPYTLGVDKLLLAGSVCTQGGNEGASADEDVCLCQFVVCPPDPLLRNRL